MENEYSGERFLPDECKGEMSIEHYQRYQLAKQLVEGKVVLDAACGEGYGSSLLIESAAKVTGLDIDAKVVERANQKYGNEKLSYVTGSIEILPFEDHTIDVVVSFETIEHVEESIQKEFLKEIVRVLKPNGILIMSTPNKKVYTDLVKGENLFHVKEFYVPEYLNFLKSAFAYNEILCQYPDTGYFITHADETVVVGNRKIKMEESRYIISISSNEKADIHIDTKKSVQFDDSMYYFLNLHAHELEQKVLEMKKETDEFEKRQEKEIKKQQEYILHLENDNKELKNYSSILEKKVRELEEKVGELEEKVGELDKELGKTLRGAVKKVRQ